MWGHHLKRRGRWWHYFRSVPERYRDVEAQREICFSLRTQSFAEAKVKASQISVDLDNQWQRSVQLGVSLKSNSAATCYAAVVQAQVDRLFAPKSANEFKDEELLARLRALMSGPTQPTEQKAILGLYEKPKLSVMGAFQRFWGHIEDEWASLSHDQKRVKYGGYIRAVRNFEKAVGHVALYELERHHALAFRTWWVTRLKSEGLNAKVQARCR